MKIVSVNYSQFKSLIDSKALLPQYIEGSDRYDLFAIEGQISWETSLLKDSGTEVTDFETNYKTSYNQPLEYRSVDGLLKYADSRFIDNLAFYTDGRNGHIEVQPGTVGEILFSFDTQYTFSGADCYWYDANWGDYIVCDVGFHLDDADPSTFQAVNLFANEYHIYRDGERRFDVNTCKPIPPTMEINGQTVSMHVRVRYYNVGTGVAKLVVNLLGWH